MFQLTQTMIAARHQSERKTVKALAIKGVTVDLVAKVAKVMSDKRIELMAEPVHQCYERMAQAVLEFLEGETK